jgi:hypothetical protein
MLWRMRPYLALVAALSPCHLVTLSSSAAEAEPTYVERALRKAGVSTEGAGILAFIRARTLSEEQRKGLANKVRALGSADYAERENASRSALSAAGRQRSRPGNLSPRPSLHRADSTQPPSVLADVGGATGESAAA